MFRSYSKNLEDILLHRALYAVENGTYVDIGAGHPIQNSVTKGFYELGWRGLNVEPRVESYRQLVIDRPGDINLCALAVGKSGDAKSFRAEQGLGEHCPNQSDVYKKLLEQSFELTNSDSVSVTLKEVLALLQGRDIHFLKIDAEAAENKVIGSEDFGFNRPWIVVVQVVEGKNDTGDRKSRINELMSSHSYHDVFFDGLNCYYLSTEKLEEFAPAFAYPVSVLDRYIRPMSEVEAVQILGEIAELLEFESAEGHQVLERVQALYNDRPSAGDSSRKIIDNLERQVEDLLQASFSRERYLAFLSAQISSLKANLSAYAAQILNSQNEISELRNSTSWKLTSLLRQLRTFASRVRKLIGKLST